MVAVLDDQDLVIGDRAGLDLRVDLRAGDPEPARGVEIHLQRLGDQGVGREQVDLETVGDRERLTLDLGVRIGDRERGALSEGRGLGAGHNQDGKEDNTIERSGSVIHFATPFSTRTSS